MGIFTKDFARQALGKIQEKRAMQATVRNNPNATAKDYLQAGMSSFSMMAAKAKAAQAAKASGGVAQPAKPFTPGFGAAIKAAQAARGAASINPMQPTAINPQAFTNQNNISGMFGAANEGTFTRTVGASPLMQMTSQGYMPPMDPTNPSEQADVSAVMASVAGDTGGYDEAVAPPMGVETPITPTYDLNNQQL